MGSRSRVAAGSSDQRRAGRPRPEEARRRSDRARASVFLWPARKKFILLSPVSTTSRVTGAWRQGDPWTVADATELYEIERWGKSYFSIGSNGHVRVHATRDPERAIDLKQ